MAQWNDNQDDPRRQQAGEQPDPIYGEAQPIPQQQTIRLSLPYAQSRAIWVLLVLNITIFAVPWLLALVGVRVLGFPIDAVVRALGAKNNQAIAQNGEYYRFLTVMFLHANLIHIGFNAYALYSLGPEAERIYGTARFLALYFIAGLAGSVTSYAFNPANGVGASGAIFGLIGGLAAFYYVARGVLGEVSRQQLGSLITVIMINLFIGFSSPVIDNTAHIGGLIGGAAVGWLLAPRYAIDTRLYPPAVVKQDWALAWPGALAVLLGLIGLVMVINPPIQ
jgi:rhomboid protease GluP